MMDNVKTANSVARTAIFLVLAGGVGYGGFVGYKNYVEPSLEAKQAIAELEALKVDFENQQVEIDKAKEENSRLQTSLQLLKIDRRMAKIKVMSVDENDEGEPTMSVRFTEFNDYGDQLGEPRDFELRGDKMYVDCWVVKFGDKYIEENDALRSASLCVFKGIYGNLDGPEGSQNLDSSSIEDFPSIYGSEEKTTFEQQIWTDFWKLANDRNSQEDFGIRTIHGQANYMKVEEGKTYEVSVRSSGAASLTPIDE